MSRYLKSWKFETDFDGDHVVVTLRPIEQGDLLRITALADPVKKTLNVASALPVFGEIIPKYIEKLEGLSDAAGAPIDVATVVKDAYFGSLLANIGLELALKAAPANPTTPVG